MKCHKCNHTSFDHLSECGKCGVDLTATRASLGFTTLVPNVPFLLGLLLESAQEGRSGSAQPGHPKETSEDFAIIDMEDDFHLADQENSGTPLKGEGGRAGGVDDLEDIEFRRPSSVSDGHEPDRVSEGRSDRDELGLSLSFEDNDELVLTPELALLEETVLQSRNVEEGDQWTGGDVERLVLDKYDGNPPGSSEAPGVSVEKAGKGKKKKSPGSENDRLVPQENFDPSAGLSDDKAAFDDSLLDDVLEFELEEIDFNDLILETEKSEAESPSEPKGASGKSSNASASE